jgi:hypothetical protein
LSALAIARNDVAAARLYLLDDRQHIGRKAVCICLVGGRHFAFTGGEQNMTPAFLAVSPASHANCCCG